MKTMSFESFKKIFKDSDREKILKDSREKAQNPVVKVKRKISKEIGRDLGLKMS